MTDTSTLLDQLEDVEISTSNHDELLKSFGINNDEKNNNFVKSSKQRTEPSRNVSIFPLLQQTEDLSTAQLLSGLKSNASTDTLKHQVNRIEKSKRLLKPSLPQVVSDRIERHAAYDATTKDISKWESTVVRNRKAEQLVFPLDNTDYNVQDGPTAMDEFIGGLKPKNPLEIQIMEMLKGSKFVERKSHDLSVAEEEALKSLTYEEAKIRREELQKHRMLMSYHEAKNKRKNKIKSKSYKRIQRKQKEKKEAAKMDKLDKNDPDQLSKLKEKAQMLRAEERAGQRHKQGSKWARKRKLIGKYDELTRLQLNEQNKLHKELKIKAVSVEEKKDQKGEKLENIAMIAPTVDAQHYDILKGNPWLRHEHAEEITETKKNETKNIYDSELIATKAIADNDEVISESDGEGSIKDELAEIKETLNVQKNSAQENKADAFRKAYQKLYAEDKKLNVDQNKDLSDEEDVDINGLDETVDESNSLNISTVRIRTIDDADEILKKDGKETNTSEQVSKKEMNSNHEKAQYIDPKKVFTLPTQSSEGLNSQDDNQMTLKEAFTDDDVINNFVEEKTNLVKDMMPKVDDTDLPGWGSWGGLDIKPKKAKKNKKPAVVKPNRKDDNLGHVIINESTGKSIQKYQVNDVPFPFTNKTQFEQNLRQPIGNTWNTPSTLKTLTKPQIVTKMGAIIEPISGQKNLLDKKKNLKKKANTNPKNKSKKKKTNT